MHPFERTISRLKLMIIDIKVSPAEESKMTESEYNLYMEKIEDLEEEITFLKTHLA